MSDQSALPSEKLQGEQGPTPPETIEDPILLLRAGRPLALLIGSKVLIINQSRAAQLLRIRLIDGGGAQATGTSPEIYRLEISGSPSPLNLIMISLEIHDIERISNEKSHINIVLEWSDGTSSSVKTVRLEPVIRDRPNPALIALACEAAKAGLIPSSVASVFSGNCQWLKASDFGPYAFDSAIEGFGGVLVQGWIANLLQRDITIFSEDLSGSCHVSEMIVSERHDVQQHLERLPVIGGTTSLHGLVAVLPMHRPSTGSLFVLERLEEGSKIFGPIPITPVHAPADALKIVMTELGRRPAEEEPIRLAQRLRPFLPRRIWNTGSHKLAIRRQASPKLSLIVPLSGEPVFLISLLGQSSLWKSATDGSFEWIFLTRRLADHASLGRLIAARADALAEDVELLLVESPHDFGFMLNRGAAAARGTALCFLHESSWLHSPEAVAQGIAGLADPASAASVFADRFEDGTWDQGLELRRDAEFPRCFLPAHTGRRMTPGERNVWPDWHGLCVRKEDWAAIDGFNDMLTNAACVGPDFAERMQVQREGMRFGRWPALIRAAGDDFRREYSLLERRALDLLDWELASLAGAAPSALQDPVS